jgi:uncharacterized membrane protein
MERLLLLEDLQPEKERNESSEISPVRPHSTGKTGRLVRASFTQSIYQGPLPPPEILKGYDLVVPGSAERILAMTEDQSKHRQYLEKIVVIGDHRKSWVGLFLGFFIASGVSYMSYDLIKRGHDVAGGILGGSVMVSLVGIFVYGGNQRSQERIEKSQSLEKLNPSDEE